MGCIKLSYLIILLYFSLTTQVISGLEEPEKVKKSVALSVDDGFKKCTMNLQSCSVKVDESVLKTRLVADGVKGEKGDIGRAGEPGIIGPPGEKGEKGEIGVPGKQGPIGLKGEMGDRGFDGLPGVKGDMGEKGDRGFDGLPGVKGDMGEKGDRGFDGLPGVKGDMGEKGDKGFHGLPGVKGDMGEKGDIGASGLDGKKGSHGVDGETGSPGLPGPRGPQGFPGPQGIAGVCGCPIEELGEPPSGEDTDTPSSSILPQTCKSLPPSSEEKNQTIRDSDPFQVLCKMNRTCLIPKKVTVDVIKAKSINYGNETQPFWLSKRGFNLIDFYGVTMDQLIYLQKLSSSVTQTIRYNCKNSYIYDDLSDPRRYLRLLLWNDILIGPQPTQNTPLFYSIIEPDKEGCVKRDASTHSSETWKFSDITITSNIGNRLPVIDFYIEDVRKEDQMFYLELRELCFA